MTVAVDPGGYTNSKRLLARLRLMHWTRPVYPESTNHGQLALPLAEGCNSSYKGRSSDIGANMEQPRGVNTSDD